MMIDTTRFSQVGHSAAVAGYRINPVASMLIALGLCAAASAAHAQAVPEPGTSPPEKKEDRAPDSVQRLDAVTVTAGKRTEKQREIAGSVTAIQGGDLEARGAKDQEDFFKLAPGVQYNKQEGDTSIITIRGVGTSATQGNFTQSTTGIYIEDVPFNDPLYFRTGPDVLPFDLQRVEILRGPQGVLFGSSSMGGAVRYLFNKPNFKATEFSLLGEGSGTSGGGANYSEFAMANLPLGSNSGVRAVAFNRNEAGYTDNTLLRLKDTNKLHQSGGRILATLEPIKELSITALYMSQTTKVDDSSNVEDVASLSKTNVGGLSPRKSQFDLASLQVNYDPRAVRLTSTTGYLTKTLSSIADLSRFAAFYGPGAYFSGDEKATAISQEFRLASHDGGPITWLGGVFYQRFELDVNDGLVAPAFGMTFPSALTSTSVESAVFAQGEYAFSNGLTVGAGGRYYRTRNDFTLDVAGSPAQASATDSGLTPRLSAKYKFGDDGLVYGLISSGYRFGGFNAVSFIPNAGDPTFVTPREYPSDSLINYEIGLRLSPAKSVRLDAAVFLLDWEDLQLSVPRPGDGFGYIASIGSARSKGLELSAAWTPISMLSLTSALAYTDAKTTAAYNAPQGLVPSGTRLPGTPKFQLANQASLRFDGPMQTSGRVSLTHSYLGKSFSNLYMTTEQGGYNLVDARVAFTTSQWELSLFVNNVANTKGVSGSQNTNLGASQINDYFVTKPRTIGASLRYDL